MIRRTQSSSIVRPSVKPARDSGESVLISRVPGTLREHRRRSQCCDLNQDRGNQTYWNKVDSKILRFAHASAKLVAVQLVRSCEMFGKKRIRLRSTKLTVIHAHLTAAVFITSDCTR